MPRPAAGDAGRALLDGVPPADAADAAMEAGRAIPVIEATRPSGVYSCFASPDIRALWLTFCLNTSFTGCQLAGSIISHSLALSADTGTMFVDSGTYAINIFAEFLKIRGAQRRTAAAVDLFAASVSVIALIVVASLDFQKSIEKLISNNSNSTEAGSGDGDDDINAPVVFGFTAGNLLIDIGMLGSIFLRNRGGWKGFFMCPCDTAARAVFFGRAKVDVAVASRAPAQGEGEQVGTKTATGELNVFSALAHVLADTMRTVTEMTMSLIVWDYQSPKHKSDVDAGSAIVVGGIILAIGAYIAYETAVQIKEEIKMRAKENEEASHKAVGVQPISAHASRS